MGKHKFLPHRYVRHASVHLAVYTHSMTSLQLAMHAQLAEGEIASERKGGSERKRKGIRERARACVRVHERAETARARERESDTAKQRERKRK